MKLALRFALALIFTVAATATARDFSTAGGFAIQQADLTLHDSARNKDIPIRVYYPAIQGKFPVIVVSHGAGGSRETMARWGRHWAGYGYVCIHPTHDDSIELRRSRGERARMRDAVRTALTDKQAWRERPRDISFVLDSLDEIERRVPNLKGKLDRDRIGVAGHSFGAYTAQAIGGAKPTVGDLRDPRVRAVVLMSPQGRNQMGMTVDSWKNFTVPAMIMTGPRDAGWNGRDPLWRKDPYLLSPPGDKYFVWVEGASHMTFSGGERFAFSSAAMQKAIQATTTAFWETYLRSDAAARQALGSGTFMPGSEKIVRVDQR